METNQKSTYGNFISKEKLKTIASLAIPRYIRSKEKIEKEKELIPIAITPLMNIYKAPMSFELSQKQGYKDGLWYGMSLSSILSCLILLKDDLDKVDEKTEILDVCCAPGMKLCTMSDLPAKKPRLTGVDLSYERLQTCKNICKKYGIENVRLVLGDGTEVFSSKRPFEHKKGKEIRKYIHKVRIGKGSLPENGIILHETGSFNAERIAALKLLGKRKRSELEKNESNSEFQDKRFDFIMVDAECTTDGSVHAVRKLIERLGFENAWEYLNDRNRIEKIQKLQQELLSEAFKVLNIDGKLCYCTCSMMKEQNEEVLSYVMERFPNLKLLNINLENIPKHKRGIFPETVYFDPEISDCSGLFVALMTRTCN